MAKKNFYAVRNGRRPGIFDSWEECKRQTDGFPGCVYKGFSTRAEAEKYMLGSAASTDSAIPIQRSSVVIGKVSPKEDAAGMITFASEKELGEYLGVSISSAAEPSSSSVTRYSQSSIKSNAKAKEDMYELEFDGASKGNPGKAGAGAVLRCPDGSVECELTVGLGIATNNVAEYRGLIMGLAEALQRGITKISVKGDSNLVVQQVTESWAVRNKNLEILCNEAKRLISKFTKFSIRHIDRELNSAADALANVGVGLPETALVTGK